MILLQFIVASLVNPLEGWVLLVMIFELTILIIAWLDAPKGSFAETR